MASFNDCLTNDGKKVFALMAKGCKVTFTKVVVGDGIMGANEKLENITTVINPRAVLPVDSVVKTADHNVIIRAVFNNVESAISAFYLREKGIYATINGEEEYLVFYANNGALAEYIDSAKTQLIEKVIRTIITFSDSDNINITLNNSAYAPPTIITDAPTIDDFKNEGNNVELGSDIILTNKDGEKEIWMYIGGDTYVQVYGTKALVIMHEYIPPSERVKGSLYLQLGKTRRLIIKIIRKFFKNEPTEDGTEDTLFFKETMEQTTNTPNGNNYRFICRNMTILQEGDEEPERLEGKFYFKANKK